MLPIEFGASTLMFHHVKVDVHHLKLPKIEKYILFSYACIKKVQNGWIQMLPLNFIGGASTLMIHLVEN